LVGVQAKPESFSNKQIKGCLCLVGGSLEALCCVFVGVFGDADLLDLSADSLDDHIHRVKERKRRSSNLYKFFQKMQFIKFLFV
jgi:hypothetical protein